MSILVANEHRDLDKRKVVAPSRYEVVGYFIAAINILLSFSLSRVRVSRETDNRPVEEKNARTTKPGLVYVHGGARFPLS